MGAHVYWLFFFVLLYWGYCITIGVTGYLRAKKGTDYFIAGRQLNVSIAPAETHQKSRLLNAITSPNVFVREAVLASAAVPGVYPPVTLAARNHLGEKQAYLPSRKWVDGSVSDDMPAKRLARLYGVNHYIVSQTAPHVLPFIADGKKRVGAWNHLRDASVSTARAWINAGASTIEKPLSHSPSLTRTRQRYSPAGAKR